MHRINKQNPKQTPVQLSRESSKWTRRCNGSTPSDAVTKTNTPDDPAFLQRRNREASVQFVKNPNSRNTYSPVDPTSICLNTSVHPVIGRILFESRNVFPTRDLWKSWWLRDQIKSKGAQILGRWRWWLQEHIPKRFQQRSSQIERNRKKSEQERGFL